MLLMTSSQGAAYKLLLSLFYVYGPLGVGDKAIKKRFDECIVMLKKL